MWSAPSKSPCQTCYASFVSVSSIGIFAPGESVGRFGHGASLPCDRICTGLFLVSRTGPCVLWLGVGATWPFFLWHQAGRGFVIYLCRRVKISPIVTRFGSRRGPRQGREPIAGLCR